MELLWKTVTGILNWNFTLIIGFNETLHWFQAGRGTGTTSLESKLPQQLKEIREAVLYEFFLDLQKAYDALDREM